MADSFPLRVGAMDIGSNAIRFSASEFIDPTHRVDLQKERVPVRLGRSAFRSGRLAPEDVAATLRVIHSFAQCLETWDVAALGAMADRAARARHGDRVRDAAGERGLGHEAASERSPRRT